MRLAHKRKVQAKLQKRTKAAVVKAVATPEKAKPVAEKSCSRKTVAAKPAVEKAVAATKEGSSTDSQATTSS